MKFRVQIIFVLLFFVFYSCEKNDAKQIEDCSTQEVSYNADIKPLVQSNCTNGYCHGGQYATYEGLKSIAESGKLFQRVITEQSMPPDTLAASITQEQRLLLECWIESGALNN